MPLIRSNHFKRVLEAHTKGRFPREFGAKLKNGGFVRNIIVRSVDDLAKECKKRNLTDCYCTVFSFHDPGDQARWDRNTVVFDEIFIDLDSQDLEASFKDAQKLVSYLLSFDITPRVYFSGSKGFHIHIDFPPAKLENPKGVWQKVFRYFQSRLKLRTLDFNVIDLARISRIPLTFHSKTGFMCAPLDPEYFTRIDYTSLWYLQNQVYVPKVVESKDFLSWIKEIDLDLSLEDFSRELKRLRRRKRRKIKGKGRKRRNKEIERYIFAMKTYGRFTGDPWIFKRHAKTVTEGNIEGTAEHKSRVFFVARCFELGYNEEEILDVFRYASNFDERKSRYYIGKIKEMVERKHGE